MNVIRPLVLVVTVAFLGSTAWAEEAHHPKAAASAAKVPKAAPGNVAAKESMAKMDDKMKAMREMHEKMMNAKTTEERSALMADHMKSMQGGMGADAKDKMKDAMPTDPATRQQMMEKRMDMMESMMQMMMDRMPAVPAK